MPPVALSRFRTRPEDAYERRWAALVVLCLCLMVITINSTAINVALPTFSKPKAFGGLGASPSQLQWIVDSYVLVFAGLLLTAGNLSDRFGRWRILALGLTIFLVFTLLSAFAPSANVLIFARCGSGVGAALIMPSTLAILTNIFVEKAERARAIGIWAGVSAIGVLVGPLTAGALLERFSWGSVFLINVPFIAAALVMGYFFVPESRDPVPRPPDAVGSLLSIVAIAIIVWALIESPLYGWRSAETLSGFALAGVMLFAFVRWELRCSDPVLDVRNFRNPRFALPSVGIGLTYLALYGMIFLLTQYLQLVLGFSALEAGAMLIPHAAMMMVFAPKSPKQVRRFGIKLVVGGGMFITAGGLAVLATLDSESGASTVLAAFLLLGFGMAHVIAPLTDAIMSALPRERAGVGSAVNDTARQIGGALGVALLGAILAGQYARNTRAALGGRIPAELLDRSGESLAGAIGLVRDLPGAKPFGLQILDAAREGFVSGMHNALVVACIVLIITAIAMIVWLPSGAVASAGESYE